MTTFTRGWPLFVAAMAISTLVQAQDPETPITQCGDLLPEGAHYSIRMNVEWDRRGEEMAGGMSVSLIDERTGMRPDGIPAEAAGLVRCVRNALGVPSGS